MGNILYKDTYPQKLYEETRGTYMNGMIQFEIHLNHIYHNPRRYEYILVRRIDDGSVERYKYYSKTKMRMRDLKALLIFKNWTDKILIKV